MKKHINFYRSKISPGLVNLGIVFLLFFTLAFACNKGGQDSGTTSNSAQTKSRINPSSTRTSGGGPTEADVKAYVSEYEQMLHPTGESSSEPISIDISFRQVQFESPRPADTGDKVRKVESDYVYPVIVEYTLSEEYSDGMHPTEKKNKFELYRNAQGGWSGFEYGPAD